MDNPEYKVGALSQFSIIDKDNRIIGGFVGDDNVDTDGHMIPIDVYKEALDEYLPWANIRDAHHSAVGKVISYGTKGWNYIEVQIVDDSVWKLIANGVYKGFSIGARAYKKTQVPFMSVPIEKLKNLPKATLNALKSIGHILRIDSMLIAEISVTDRPINQAALFAKSHGNMPVLQSIIDKDMITVTSTPNLAPLGSLKRKKRKVTKEKKMEKTLDTVTADNPEAVLEDAAVVNKDVQADAPTDGELVEKAMPSDSTTAVAAIPPHTDGEAQPVEDKPDTNEALKSYIDSSLINLFNSIVEQVNISNNMLGEKIMSVVSAMMNQVMQCMTEEDSEAEPTPNETEVTEPVQKSVDVATAALTPDVVKSIVASVVTELFENAPILRKGTVNSNAVEVVPPIIAPPMTKEQQIREVALRMAQATIK